MVWRVFVGEILQPYLFPVLERTSLARLLQLHDATAVPNVLQSEREIAAAYAAAEEARLAKRE